MTAANGRGGRRIAAGSPPDRRRIAAGSLPVPFMPDFAYPESSILFVTGLVVAVQAPREMNVVCAGWRAYCRFH
jgi:hypothetical protein